MLVQQIAVSLLVIITMGAIGLRTPANDFAVVWKRPIPLLIALLINLVVAPLIMLSVLPIMKFPPAAAIGFLICAASPGGPLGALFAMLAKAHVATAVTAMVMLSLLSVLTAPLTIAWGLGRSDSMDASRLIPAMMTTLIAMQMLPLLLGLLIRRFRQPWAERLAGPMAKIANGLLGLIVVGLLVTKGHMLLELGVAGIVYSIGSVLMGLGLGALVSRQSDEKRSYSSITGVRNTSLALLISSTYFPNSTTDAAILTFAFFSIVLPLMSARILGART
jgi:bile acid:Na+ symporter, BASS family